MSGFLQGYLNSKDEKISFNFGLRMTFCADIEIKDEIIDKLIFEPKRLAPLKNQLIGISKKQKRKLTQKNKDLHAPFLAKFARSFFCVFLIVISCLPACRLTEEPC